MKIVHPSQGGPGTTPRRHTRPRSSPTNPHDPELNRRLDADVTGILARLAESGTASGLAAADLEIIERMATGRRGQTWTG
jgi:hypothetical protein